MIYKKIHIGALIKSKYQESSIEMTRASKFLKSTEKDIREMFMQESMDTEVLLRWSKLLEYDFFRIFTQHLILYSPPSAQKKEMKKSVLPSFRKNIYTKEVVDFIIALVESNEKTKQQIIEEYRIPKTTLYKWMNKYGSKE